MSELIEPKTYRDRPDNLDESGDKKFIRARKPKGKWYTRRQLVGYTLLLFLVIAPFIKINNHPFALLDIANRQFYLFGQLIVAQDTYILALLMAVVVVFIVLFTVVFGRLWCGWACPQTLFLELVFRKIEYLFEGDYRKNKKPLTGLAKRIQKIAKHGVYILTSIFFTNAFVNWFVGPERLFEIIQAPIQDHLLGFSFMMGISLFYYAIYAYFREQVCTMFCPYGRMQGVLLDSKSITVIYDYKRGEPRGSKNKGDCIDCGACISVCPTGIDIKNGSQLECINCTACIDECNGVMTRINKPQGLIRYDSHHGLETGKKSIRSARTYAYSSVLLVLIAVLGITVSKRTSIETSVIRLPGTLYQQVDSVTVSNMYNLKIVNKTNNSKNLEIRLLEPEAGKIELIGSKTKLEKLETYEGVLVIKLSQEEKLEESTSIKIGFFENGISQDEFVTNFVGPKN